MCELNKKCLNARFPYARSHHQFMSICVLLREQEDQVNC